MISLRIGHLKNQMKYEWSRRSRTNYAMIKQEREQRSREKTVGGWANTSLRNTFLFEILFLSDSPKISSLKTLPQLYHFFFPSSIATNKTMEKIDINTNSNKIQQAYDKVVRGDPNATFVVYSVDKNATMDVTETGDGSLEDFVEHFTDGQVQFGFSQGYCSRI